MTTSDWQFGYPQPSDGAHLWTMARDSGVLDVNSSYAYLLWCRDFRDTSAVVRAAGAGTPVGFVTGYRRPAEPSTLFVWQLAVDPAQRGHGLAGRLLDHLVNRLIPAGVRHLEASVTDTNVASTRTFDALARRWNAPLHSGELFTAGDFPDGKPAESLLRIGPFAHLSHDQQ